MRPYPSITGTASASKNSTTSRDSGAAPETRGAAAAQPLLHLRVHEPVGERVLQLCERRDWLAAERSTRVTLPPSETAQGPTAASSRRLARSRRARSRGSSRTCAARPGGWPAHGRERLGDARDVGDRRDRRVMMARAPDARAARNCAPSGGRAARCRPARSVFPHLRRRRDEVLVREHAALRRAGRADVR